MTATHLANLRLHTAEADSPALRLAVARELGGADLTPPGLPPSAVMLVRRLEDPQPGSFGAGGFRPPPAWERALRERLGETARRAVRPDRWGRLPADASAVVFADAAELLACRLRSLAAGEPEPWWTARLSPEIGGGPIARDPVALLTKEIRELPAVFQRLAEWGAALPVLQSIREPEVKGLLGAMVNEWSLPTTLVGHPPSFETATEKHQVKGALVEAELAESRPAGELGRAVVEQEEDPWAPWLPPQLARASLPPAVRALAGVAFGLARFPSRLRSPVLAAKAAAWWRQVEAGGDSEPESPSPRRTDPRSEHRPRSRPVLEVTETPRSPEHGQGAAPSSFAEAPAARRDRSERSRESRDEVAPGTPDVPFSDIHAPEGQPPPYLELLDDAVSGSESQQEIDPASAAFDSDPLAFLDPSGDTFLTAWGGVFYLIHLLEDQGLPRAAEDEWHLETLAGPWGTLDLVARGLLAHRFPKIAGDPLWPVLEQLAGWPEGRDVPPPRLGDWLEHALPALRDRLLLALDEDAEEEEGPDPIERLLAVPARVHLTSSHLDVVTGLDQMWLPARRAGLDRNPGWLPDYGRVVLIHFTEHGHFEELGGEPS